MLFTAFNPTNKAFLFSPSLLYPLPYFTLFITAKTAKYIIRSLIAVTLTHLSTPLPPDSFQYCSPSLPLLLSGLLAQALSCFEVVLFIQPAWDVVVCGRVRGGRALFRWTKCQGLTTSVFMQRLASQLRRNSSKCSGNVGYVCNDCQNWQCGLLCVLLYMNLV